GSGAAHHAACGATTGAGATGRRRGTGCRAGTAHALTDTGGAPGTGCAAGGPSTAHALGRAGGRTTTTAGRAEPARRGRTAQLAAVGRGPASRRAPGDRSNRPHATEPTRTGTRGGHPRGRRVRCRARARHLALAGRTTRHRGRRGHHTRRVTPTTARQVAHSARTATTRDRRPTTGTTRIPRSARRIRRTTRDVDDPGTAADTALVPGTGREGRRLRERRLLGGGLVEVLVVGVHDLRGLLVGRVGLLARFHGLVERADRVQRVVLDRGPEVLHQPVGLDRLGHRVLRRLGGVGLRIRRLRRQLRVRR